MRTNCLMVVLVLLPGLAAAQIAADKRERCATRLSSVLLGRSPSSTLLASADPQLSVDTMLASADFIERFSRYVNASFNVDPGATPAEDASYYLSKYVLQNNLPWRQMFVGGYQVNPPAADAGTTDAQVILDANGLGYFRSRAWMVRYAGSELNGVRLVAAYRMLNNVLGVKLQAAVNTDGIDAAGRTSAACSGCHYNSNNGLDLIAKILTKRIGTGSSMTFSTTVGTPSTLLGGQTITDDKSFVTAMVNSIDFRYRGCRLAAEFLYARSEYKCEGLVFDKCMASFTSTSTIQSAIATLAKDPSFCQ
jgi:hypothetical protein